MHLKRTLIFQNMENGPVSGLAYFLALSLHFLQLYCISHNKTWKLLYHTGTLNS